MKFTRFVMWEGIHNRYELDTSEMDERLLQTAEETFNQLDESPDIRTVKVGSFAVGLGFTSEIPPSPRRFTPEQIARFEAGRPDRERHQRLYNFYLVYDSDDPAQPFYESFILVPSLPDSGLDAALYGSIAGTWLSVLRDQGASDSTKPTNEQVAAATSEIIASVPAVAGDYSATQERDQFVNAFAAIRLKQLLAI